MRLPVSLDVLKERSFARYLAAIAVDNLGSGMAMVALAFAVLEFGGATDLGIVLLAREIPLILLLLLGGVFADHVPRRTILVVSDLVMGAAQVATAILLFSGTADVWNVAVLQAVFSMAGAFSRPATTGMVREAVSDGRLQEANALLGLSSSVFFIAGPAIGAIIVATGSPAWAIAVDSVTFFVSAALIASMHLTATVRIASASILGDLRDGWREFVERSWAVAMVVSFGLFQLTYFPALLVLGPLVAKQDLGGAGAWGAILAVESLGAVVGGMFALRLRFKRPLVASQLMVVPALAGRFSSARIRPAERLRTSGSRCTVRQRGGLMGRWLAWIGNVVSMALGGSVVMDPANSGHELAPADAAAPRWVARMALLAPLAVLILILARVPWPIAGAVAAILLLPLVIHRIRVLRRR